MFRNWIRRLFRKEIPPHLYYHLQRYRNEYVAAGPHSVLAHGTNHDAVVAKAEATGKTYVLVHVGTIVTTTRAEN